MDQIQPYTFTGSAIVVGLLLTKELKLSEQASVGNWLQLVGLIVQTYSTQKQVVNSKEENDPKKSEIEILKKAIKRIEKQLNNLS